MDSVIPPEVAPFDHVGLSVGLADGWLVAGADGDDEGGEDAGAVWVYQRAPARRWTLADKLVGVKAGGHFGWAVDTADGLLAVGAPGEGADAGAGAGAVHVYALERGAWVEGPPLPAVSAEEGARVGASVRVRGPRLIVGAPGDQAAGLGAALGAGAAWIFARGPDGWRLEAELAGRIDEGVVGSGLGASVALSDEVAVVGAPEDAAGIVYVFRRVDGRWEQEASLRAPGLAPGARFGAAVDCDGATLVVGAESLSAGGQPEGGGAFIYSHHQGGWGAPTRVIPRDAMGEAHFGAAVRLVGDGVAVGAWQAATAAGAAGAIYLFTPTKAGWLERSKLIDELASDGDRLGVGIVTDGVVVAAGAWSADTRGPDTGKILLFTDRTCASSNDRSCTSAGDGACP